MLREIEPSSPSWAKAERDASPSSGRRALLLFPPLLLLITFRMNAQDVVTYHNDNARTGQSLNETTLTLTSVNPATFGKLFALTVDGKVDAQPLYASAVSIPGKGTHNVLVVASEHDSVYGFDADTGATLWQVSLLKSGETTSDDRGCGQVTPEIGITATPVIDRTEGIVYVVAMSKDVSGSYVQRLHALNLTSGAEMLGGPTDIEATFPGTGDNSSNGNVIFDPKQYKERPGLLLLNHVVYTSWSSHCDIRPYTGWVIGYHSFSLKQFSVLNLAPNGSGASVWASGAGPAADAQGNIYLLAANGTFETTLDAAGFPPQGDFGNAFLKLSVTPRFGVADYFNMFNTVAESSADGDLGSGGALVLPDMMDAQGRTRHLAVGAGKDQNIYLVDRDLMGRFSPNSNNAIYQEISGGLHGAEFGMPAYFNQRVYFGAVGDSILAFDFSDALLHSNPSSKTTNTFGYPGATPSVSANGTSNGIVWAAENSNPAVLHAYDATDLSRELYNSNQAGSRDLLGPGNKFITPTIANGKVYVGTTNGVAVFGLLQSGGPAVSLSARSLSFSSQVVGAPGASQTLTLTNSGQAALGISGLRTSGDFSQTSNCGSSIGPGANCQITVTFSPTAGGTRSGTLTIVDTAPGSPQTIELAGIGADFSVAAPNSTITVRAGQTATYTLSITAIGGFRSAISLACSGAPSEATCSVSPASVAPSGSTALNATVTVATTAPSQVAPQSRIDPPLGHFSWLFAFIGLPLMTPLICCARRRALSPRDGLMTIVIVILFFGVFCGGGTNAGANANRGTPLGSYTLMVTATFASGSATLEHRVSLTLTVD